MLHKDLIKTRKGFSPVYSLDNEEHDRYWRTYIPHGNFYELLQKVIRVLRGTAQGRTAIWLQGAYGTGKSHTCGVLKHLLSDPLEEIEDYLKTFDEGKGKQIAVQWEALREHKRYLVITLKGNTGIVNERYMEFLLKEAIRKTAKEKYGINLTTKTEIDLIVEDLEGKTDEWVRENFETYTTKEALIEALREGDESALEEAINTFAKLGKFYHIDLNSWLKEVNKTLREKGFSGIFIIWDEFTSLLEEGFISKVQNILAENPNLYLLIVTHKTAEQLRYRLEKDTLKKIQDRFELHLLTMQDITTFQILSRTLEKVNENLWKLERHKYFTPELKNLAKIFEEHGVATERVDLKDLYPIHPYTAFLISYTVNHFMSANRSLFEILYSEDENKGVFNKFLNKEVDKEPFFTADYLWDFFHSAVKEGRTDEFSNVVIRRYELYEDSLKQKGDDYLKVFKALLMMNILYKSSPEGNKLIIPSEENLKLTYLGTPVYEKLPEILDFINREGIIHRDPHGRFILVGETLPPEEVAQKRRTYEGKFKTAISIVESYPKLKQRLKEILNRNPLRKRSVKLIKEKATIRNLIERKIEKESYVVNIFVALPTYASEIGEYRTLLREISSKYPEAVFVVFDTSFGEEELKAWINYRAKQEVAESHNLSEKTIFEENAKKIVERYVNELESGKIYLFFRGVEKSLFVSRFDSEINDLIAPTIFDKAPDVLVKRNEEIRNENLWRETKAMSLLEKVLNARSLEELRGNLSGVDRRLENLLWDENGNWVVDRHLRIKEEGEHPLAYLYQEVKRIFDNNKYCQPSHFEGLKRSPFGVYKNKIFYFLLALVFKNLEGELYKEGHGKAQQLDLIKFLQGILESRRVNLYLRLGSQEDKKLARLLVEVFTEGLGIFDLTDEDDFVKVRNQIRDFLRNSVGYPLWVLKYHPQISKSLKDAIETLSEFLITHEKELTEERKLKTLRVLEDYTIDLKELVTSENIKTAWREFIGKKLLGREIDEKLFERKLKEELNTDANFWNEGTINHIADKIVSELLREAERIKLLEKEEKSKTPKVEEISNIKPKKGEVQAEPVKVISRVLEPNGVEVEKPSPERLDSYRESSKENRMESITNEEKENFSPKVVSIYVEEAKKEQTPLDWRTVIESLEARELRRLIKELAEESKEFEERLIQWLRRQSYLTH